MAVGLGGRETSVSTVHHGRESMAVESEVVGHTADSQEAKSGQDATSGYFTSSTVTDCEYSLPSIWLPPSLTW